MQEERLHATHLLMLLDKTGKYEIPVTNIEEHT